MNKRIFSFLLILCVLFSMSVMPAHAASSGTCGDNLTWTLNNSGTLTISGTGAMTNYSGFSSSVPWYSSRSSIKTVVIGDSVTSIGNDAFRDCDSLTSITIPAGVTSIGDYAFYDCDSLTSITIPAGVKSIGNYAFRSCSSLTTITIPDSVTSIGEWAFSSCYRLTSITIPAGVRRIGEMAFSYCSRLTSINASENNQNYSSQGGVLFNKDKTALISCPGGKSGSYNIPDSVTSIGSHAFYSCDSLTSITIPAGVTSIGESAFRYCSSLKSITIPASVTSIGSSAFSGCSRLTDVYLQRGASISVGSYNEPYLNATKHYYYIVSYNTNGGTLSKDCDAIMDQTKEVILPAETPQKDGYIFIGWSLSENTGTIDYRSGENIGVISDNMTLYAAWWEETLNGVNISTIKRNVNVGETFTADIRTRWGNDYNYLLSEIKFSKDLILKSITPVDFKYAEQDGEFGEDENYKYLTVIAQYSDENYAEADKVYTPFRLKFELNKYCPLDSVSITHTENSLAIGDEEYPLPAVTTELGVIPKLADSIKITQNETEPGIYSFSAEVLPDYTRNKTVLWSIDNENIATISQDGVLTVLKNGTVTVTARTTDGSNLSDSKMIDVVVANTVTNITILQGEQISNKVQFTATVLPETAENKNVIWSVDDESIATISQDGLLTILQNGTVTVTATAQDGFGAKDSKSVTFTLPVTVNSLSSNAGVWDKAFEPYVYDYTVYVPNDTNAISFNANWDSGTTKCNGSLMVKGRDKQVTLTDDITTITIKRTGVSDYTDSEYKIKVVKGDGLFLISPYEILGNSIRFNIATLILDNENEYSLFAAGYDSNKKLVSLSKVSAESGYNELSVNLDNANDAVNYKIMLLTDELMPYTKALEGSIVR